MTNKYNDIADEILMQAKQNGWVNYDRDTHRNRIIDELISKGFLFKNNKNDFKLTEKGLNTIEKGSIKKYQDDLNVRQEIDDKIKLLTLKQLQGSIFQLKYWWLPLVISGIIGLLSGNIKLILKLFGIEVE